jgi:lysine-specific demethylase/histidyl-hydroxylase NO66
MKRSKNDEGGSNGGSRAAKKRAKQKANQEMKSKMENMKTPADEKEVGKETTAKGKNMGDTGSALAKTAVEPTRHDDNGKRSKKNNKANEGHEAVLLPSANVEKELGIEMEDFYPSVPEVLALREPDDKDSEDKDDGLTTKQAGHMILQSLLYPGGISVEEFYAKYWEKEALYISAAAEDDNESTQTKWAKGRFKHRTDTRFESLFSSDDMKEMIKTKGMQYTYDLNVTKCDDTTNMRRVNFDTNEASKGEGLSSKSTQPAGEPSVADCKVVWNRFKNEGCTVRYLCPQKHHDAIHALCSTMESEFGCMVGCNAYLTPGHASQGFAPHYDDIEAFILQVEGRKRWRVYAPLNGRETLPRISSDDFVMEEPETVKVEDSDDPDATANKYDGRLVDGMGRRKVLNDPVLDVVLEPGDLLYLPRGWIHQAVTPGRENEHSLHLTMSCMQQWSWADFMEQVIPDALEAAIQNEKSTLLREGLPIRFLDFMGVVHDTSDSKTADKLLQVKNSSGNDSDDDDGKEENGKRFELLKQKAREKFKERAKKCINKVWQEAMSSIDAACDHVGKRFMSDRLPPALTENEKRTTSEKQARFKIMPNTMCRIVRDGIARLVIEDDKAVVYHCVDNSREFHGNPISPLEFELDDAPALEMVLLTAPPHWICVQDLIHDDIEDKVGVAQALFDEGVISILNQ